MILYKLQNTIKRIKKFIQKYKPLDMSGDFGIYETFDELKNSKTNSHTTDKNIDFIKELDELREVLHKTKREPNKDEMLPNSD